MEATAFFGFILTVIIGIGFLAVVLKALDPGRHIVAQEETTLAPEVVPAAVSVATAIPAFFAKRQASMAAPSQMLTFDEGLFAFLQSHVKAEQAVVSEFVRLPSVDTLYRQSQPSLTMN